MRNETAEERTCGQATQDTGELVLFGIGRPTGKFDEMTEDHGNESCNNQGELKSIDDHLRPQMALADVISLLLLVNKSKRLLSKS